MRINAMAAVSPKNSRENLNQLYSLLDDQMWALLPLLRDWHGMKITYGYYNGHYHKDAAGEYQKDVYPIPVISVMGLCDIEIDFDGTTVTAKLSREQLEETDWSDWAGIPFEVYGFEDYLLDFGTGQNAKEMRRRALASLEKEFFISFFLPPAAQTDQVMCCLESIYRKQFYY